MNELNTSKRGLSKKPLKILAISGSLRAASFSTAILHAISREEYPGITLSVKTLEDVPLYNEDLDTDPALATDRKAA